MRQRRIGGRGRSASLFVFEWRRVRLRAVHVCDGCDHLAVAAVAIRYPVVIRAASECSSSGGCGRGEWG